jgi:DNA-binding transcriptional LysR family regulator
LLETEVGARLFDRFKRDIRLTPEGNRLLRHADSMIAAWRKARQDVSVGGAAQQLSFGGSLRLWDVFLQDWLHRLRIRHPAMALIAESHTPEVLTRRLLDGVLDVALVLEPSQLDVLQIERIATVELLLVSTWPGLDLEQALAEGYLMVDWGLAHALTHRRLFPDAPEPQTRLSTAKMAIGYMAVLGGSAFLPRHMIAAELDAGELHAVDGAPAVEHPAYAVYPVRSPRTELIEQVLPLFAELD